MDYPRFIKDDYVPSYIIASNQEDVFRIHAENLCQVLSGISSEYEYFYEPKETDDLEHGFLTKFDFSPNAALCMNKMLKFISEK